MGEITFPVSQTFCDRLCDFFKWIVCSDNSVSKTAIDCVGNTPNDFNKSPCTGDLLIDDGYLILACIANNPVLNSKLCCYEPLFSSSVKIRVFSETVSSWSLALKRRRLERSCREEPFVRYDMAFVNNELKNMWQKRSDEVKLFEEGQFVVDDKDVDGCCLTRSPSPCRSNSTLSSAYSSEELSTVSSMTLRYVPTSNSFDRENFSVSEMDVLSEEIWDYHMSVTQTEEILNLKMQLRDVLYCALSQLFPMCGLYIVGSSLNGFGTNSSDMDLCLMISCKEINQRTDAVVVLDLVRNLFQNINFIREQKLIIAKVPILRLHFYEPYGNIVVDLNANNSVAIRNTQLLCYYSYYDWRVRPLVSVVKEWAKRRDINDANRSSFTSYSLVLMVIHYLQCEAKVLPSLQEKYPKVFNQRIDVRTLSVSLPLEPQGFCQKTPTLGELLLGFFEYFAIKFDYEKDAISIRLGRKTERRLVANQLHNYNGRLSQWNCICIEEPFNYSNTAHSVHDQNLFDQIKYAFLEDYENLERTRDLHAFLDVNPLNSSFCLLERYTIQLSSCCIYSMGSSSSSEMLSGSTVGLPTGGTSSTSESCQVFFSVYN
ncbi:unnamed protein product [Enterobius vermicularis]|uniref:PAP-associated domain-containing protein n=1 Tax=Enterobius vermicularis TaxID=51028 RepID=A0A158QA29_ENTVE|nr:unnamed protein product [Enterobius vermicularis]